MLHARDDYSNIQEITTNGTTRRIPADEPVFLIRGQDAVGAAAVRAWADLAEAGGADRHILAVARDHADKMDRWPKKKVADLTEGRAQVAPTARAEAPAGERIDLTDIAIVNGWSFRWLPEMREWHFFDASGSRVVAYCQLRITAERFANAMRAGAAALAPAPAAGGERPTPDMREVYRLRALMLNAHRKVIRHGWTFDGSDAAHAEAEQLSAKHDAAWNDFAAYTGLLDRGATAPTPQAAPEGLRIVVRALDNGGTEFVEVEDSSGRSVRLPWVKRDDGLFEILIDAAPAAPGAGVDLAVVEAALDDALDVAGEYALLAVRAAISPRHEQDAADASEGRSKARTAVLDAVRALVRPSGEIVGLLEDWRRAIIDNRKGTVERKVVRAAEDAVHAAIAALGRDAAGRGGGAREGVELTRMDWKPISSFDRDYTISGVPGLNLAWDDDTDMPVALVWCDTSGAPTDWADLPNGPISTLAGRGGRTNVPEELRKLSDAATPGPWTVDRYNAVATYHLGVHEQRTTVEVVRLQPFDLDSDKVGSEEDLYLIAQAVNDLRGRLASESLDRGGGAGVPEELRRLSEAATPGPWEIINKGPQANPNQVWHDGQNAFVCETGDLEQAGSGPGDAAFIAAAVNNLRARIAAEDRDRGADGREG